MSSTDRSADVSDRAEDDTDVDELDRSLNSSRVASAVKAHSRPFGYARSTSYTRQRRQRPTSSRARSEVGPYYGRLAPRRRSIDEQYDGHSATPQTADRSKTPIIRQRNPNSSGHDASSSSSSELNRQARLQSPVDRTPRAGASSANDYFSVGLGLKDAYLPSEALVSMPLLSRTTTYSSLPPSPIEVLNAFAERSLPGVVNRRSFSGVDLEDLPSEYESMDGGDGPDVRRNMRAISLPPEDMLADGGQGLGMSAGLPELTAARNAQDSPIDPPRDGVSSSPAAKSAGSSLWAMLSEELSAEEQHEHFKIDGKWERISNFLAVPAAIERITLFGALVCLDSFLYNFTLLPLRAAVALIATIRSSVTERALKLSSYTHLQAIIRALLVVIPTIVLVATTDASKMYHTVRGQDTIKLYVIFNSLEIADKLCGAFGQDILDTLFARETLDPTLWPTRVTSSRVRHRKRERARPFFFFVLALAYVHIHALVFFYQLVSLNVAINSYDNALLTLLVSNQFVEIKGSVFKKFEKENLFQIMCADIVERFQLAMMLGIISVRNLIEMAGSDFALLPKSYKQGKSLVETILSPVTAVILSELAVDWLKHGFITKFNHIRTTVYGRYTDVLCKDLLLAGGVVVEGDASGQKRQRHALFVDRSPLVSRRLGFAALPLACLVLRVAVQTMGMFAAPPAKSGWDPVPASWGTATLRWAGLALLGIISWLSLIALKLLLGLNLLAFASRRQAGMADRERTDDVKNDFKRPPIAVSEQESRHEQDTKRYLRSDTGSRGEADSQAATTATPRRPAMATLLVERGDDSQATPLAQRARSRSSASRAGSRARLPALGVMGSNGGIADRRRSVDDRGVTPRTVSKTTDAHSKPDVSGEFHSAAAAGGGGGKKWKLEDIERWTMVKRIF